MDIKEIMKKLSFDYCSEKDFQIDLALKLINKDIPIVCEYPYKSNVEYKFYKKVPGTSGSFEKENDNNAYIDIVCYDNNNIIPIELKYRTKKQKIKKIINEKNIIEFDLKEQSAHDDGCYGFLRDICRIAEFIEKEHCNEGYAVFLTNDEKYKKGYNGEAYSGFWFGKQKNGNEESEDDMYGNKGIIYDTNGNTSLLYYENGNIGKVNGTYRKLVLPPSEQVEWGEWQQTNNGFHFLVVKISNKG